ncbi:hypothetical protein [Saccharopolyspora sp. NPDC002376]
MLKNKKLFLPYVVTAGVMFPFADHFVFGRPPGDTVTEWVPALAFSVGYFLLVLFAFEMGERLVRRKNGAGS